MRRSAEAALAALEERLGHGFSDRQVLLTALTHPSASGGGKANYQRLEFLGDRVLGLVISEILFRTYPNATEGELSRRLAELVRKETCAAVAVSIGLGDTVRLGGRSQQSSLLTTNVLGDVTEAVIAAIYLDGGLEAARRFIAANWDDRVLAWEGSQRDAKTTLQEWSQARGLSTPSYEIVDRIGPDHETRFTIEVRIESLRPGHGEGRSRREAEQDAARAVLVREGAWEAERHGV